MENLDIIAKTQTAKGRLKRLARQQKKATNFKGFGESFKDKDFRWFVIEWKFEDNDRDDLIELQWLKVLRPKGKYRIRLNAAMKVCFNNDVPPHINVEAFLAAMYMGEFSDKELYWEKGCNCGFLYPASRKGDLTIREPISQVFGSWNDGEKLPHGRLIQTVIFKFVLLDETVPAEQVSLTNRRVRR